MTRRAGAERVSEDTPSTDGDRLELLSIGSWAIFDHIATLERYPDRGSTVEILTPLADLEDAYFGDCSANVAAVAASLGAEVGLAMVVGDDFESSGYKSHLEELGIDLSAVQIVAGQRSGHNFLYYAPNGHDMCLSQLGIAARQGEWKLPVDAIEQARTVVINEKFCDFTLRCIRYARAAGAMTVVNGMVGTAGDLAQGFLAETDLLFISESEAGELCDAIGVDDVSQVLNFGPKNVFVTRGTTGSEVLGRGVRYAIPPVQAAQVVDTTGAGDAYVAGTLVSLVRGHSLEEAATFGAAAASFVVQARGAQGFLPTFDQLTQRLRGAAGEGDT